MEAAAYQRAGLLLARLLHEASDGASVVHGAAFGDGCFVAFYSMEDCVLARGALRKPAAELTDRR